MRLFDRLSESISRATRFEVRKEVLLSDFWRIKVDFGFVRRGGKVGSIKVLVKGLV